MMIQVAVGGDDCDDSGVGDGGDGADRDGCVSASSSPCTLKENSGWVVVR